MNLRFHTASLDDDSCQNLYGIRFTEEQLRLINETLVLSHIHDENEEDKEDNENESDYEDKDESNGEEIVQVILAELL